MRFGARGSSAARRRGERGTMTLFLLGICIAILFLAGIVVDFWRVIAERRTLASMADAAASAGANGVDQSSLRTGGVVLAPDLVRRLALDELAAQAQVGEITQSDVTVGAQQVRVRLQGHVRFSLLGVLLGGGQFVVTVSATAEPRRSP